MDISALATQAVDLAANHLWAIASGVVDRAEASATGRLYELMRDRLHQTRLGTAVLGDLEEQPHEPGRRSMAATALAQAATADEEFAARLQQVVHEVSVSQGTADHAAISGQVNLNAGGDLTMSRSNVAAGDIDASRKYHIGTGGIVLAILAVLLVGGGTTAIVIGTDDGERDPATIGRDPGEAGVRETTEGFLSSIGARDAKRFCAFLSTDELTFASDLGGCEQAAQDLVFNRISLDLVDTFGGARIDQVTINDTGSEATVHMSSGEQGDAEWRLQRELGRWVIAEKVFPREGTQRFSEPSGSTPQGVAEAVVDAANDGDVDAIVDLSCVEIKGTSEDSRENLGQPAELADIGISASLELGDVRQDGDDRATAEVSITFDGVPDDMRDQFVDRSVTMELVKENDDWAYCGLQAP